MSYQTGTATDYVDLLDKLNTFLTSQGMTGSPSYAGTGNGTIAGLIGGSASVAETITIQATSSTSFSVSGSVSGAIGTATVGVAFVSTKINFTITAGGTAFVAGDAFTLATTPPWIQKRSGLGTKRVTGAGWTSIPNANDGNQASGGLVSSNINFPALLVSEFYVAKEVKRLDWWIGSNINLSPKNFSIDYSDDGVSWTTAQSFTNISWVGSYSSQTFLVTGSPGAHRYWRVNITAANGTSTQVDCLEFELFEFVSGSYLRIENSPEAIWQAPGADGASSIFVGARGFQDVGGDYYNWRLAGFSAFDPNARFAAQAGSPIDTAAMSAGAPALTLWNSPITYWFVANGRRVIIVAKISTVYVMGYLGLISQYMSPTTFSYPLFVGGNYAYDQASGENAIGSALLRWSATGGQTANFWRARDGVAHGQSRGSQGRLRKPDGTWSGFSSVVSLANMDAISWPFADGIQDVRPNLDGSYTPLPVIAWDRTPNVWGELDGVFYVTGFSNTAENTITIGLSTYLVVPNVYRTDRWNYCAVKLI